MISFPHTSGEIQYRQRIEDIRLLKLEIKKLRREKHILTKSVSNVEELRREVYNMQRELLRERTRCKALEEELENPMNIHRWRKLEVCFFLFFLSLNSTFFVAIDFLVFYYYYYHFFNKSKILTHVCYFFDKDFFWVKLPCNTKLLTVVICQIVMETFIR